MTRLGTWQAAGDTAWRPSGLGRADFEGASRWSELGKPEHQLGVV